MILTIPATDARKYFNDLLKTLRIFKPFSEMTGVELRFFALLLYYYHKKRGFGYDDANAYIFGKNGRLRMMNDMGWTRYSVNNYLMRLRKYGLITYDNIVPRYLFKYNEDGVNEIIFKFISNGKREEG